MSLYDDLGVSPNASADEINAAYRKAAKEHHPDKGGDPAVFAKIGRAVAVLRDPERRAEYDQTGREDFTETHPESGARAQLIAAFSSMLVKFVKGHLDGTSDLITLTQRALQQRAREQRAEAKKVRNFLARSEDALSRLKRKGDGPDLLRDVIQSRNAEAARMMEQMTKMADELERASEMAEDWEWRADAPPEDMWVQTPYVRPAQKPIWTGLDFGGGTGR